MKSIKHNHPCLPVLALTLALALCLPACGNGKSDNEENTTESTKTTTISISESGNTALTIIENGTSAFTIVRPDEAGDTLRSATTTLVNRIREHTDVMLKPTTDWYNTRGEKPALDDPEILIGETNRDETAEVLASLPEHGYAVTVKNNKLVIVGTDTNMTVLALYAFEEKILSDPDKCAAGKLIFSETDSFTVTMDSALTLADMIKTGHTISNTSTKVVQTDKQGQYSIGQGSCSDGTYVYFVLRNSGDTGSVITKHRLDDGSFVGVSDVLALGHGNDMTYDAKNNRLVVAHGQSEGQILTLVDPDTLTLIKDIGIPKGSGAITYSAEKDRYAISQGGSTLHILDGNFKWITSYSRTDKTGYTAQGMGSDEDYIYFPMSSSGDNVLVVYDWNGNYVTTLTVSVPYESESMFWVNDRYYIAYNTAGEALYEIVFELHYE